MPLTNQGINRMKKGGLGIILISALFAAGGVLAVDNINMSGGERKQTAAEGKHTEAVTVGNKICPVMGEKIDEKTKVTYEYKGKIYNLCCAACLDEFKKNPEKYLKKIEEEKAKEKGTKK